MSWKTFIAWLRGKKKVATHTHRLDQKLVRNNQKYLIPQWSQLKYLKKFLTTREKITLLSSICLAVVSVGLIITFFVSRHITRLPANGGEYREALIGQPKYINPLYSATNDVDAGLVSLIYSGLFRYTTNNAAQQQLTPDLAAAASVSDDKKVYTITLRSGVRWSDGEPFSADDVIYTFQLIQNPEVGSPLLSAFEGVQIEKISNEQIRFTLKEPFAPFLTSLTVGIMPEHIWRDITPVAIRLTKNNLQPIGTGPWQFKRLIKDDSGTIQSYSLSQNENYFNTHPYLNTLHFKFFTGVTYEQAMAQALEALRSNQVDALGFISPTQKNKLNSKHLDFHTLQLPQYTALFLNTNQSAVLKNLEVRRALTEAIQKPTIIQQALQNAGKSIDSPFLEGILGYNADAKKINFDVAHANTLLDKKWTRIEPEEYFKIRSASIIKNRSPVTLSDASSTTRATTSTEQTRLEQQINASIRAQMNPRQTFYRRDKEGNLLSLTITTINTAEYVGVAELVANMWAALGIQTTVKKIDASQVLRDILKNHQYEILLYGEIIGSDPDPFAFWHSSQIEYPGLNIAQFSNRTADKLLETARITVNDSQRADLYKKFQSLLSEEIPAIFLYTPTHLVAANKDIHGISDAHLNSPADRYYDSVRWYTKTSWQWK